jgi:glycosyltransferase involved in cell wall biosynthesis
MSCEYIFMTGKKNKSKNRPDSQRKKVLYITPTLLYPPAGGNYLRVYNVIKALSGVVDLDILFLGEISGMGGVQAVDHLSKYCGHIYTYETRPKLYKRALRHFFRNIYWCIMVLRTLRKDNYHLLWLGYGNISYELVPLRFLAGLPLVVDTDSVWSRYALRHIPYTPGFINKLRWYWRGYLKRLAEIIGTNLADITTAVSEFDSQYYLKITPFKNRIKILPNIVGTNEAGKEEQTEFVVKNPAICYSGSMAGPANNEAALWLLDRVMPLLWPKYPNLTVYLVGYGPSEELLARRTDRVVVTGKVNNVISYLQKVDVVVVPLHFESGTRYKILEAWASECAIISTTLGAEGLNYIHGKHILIADTPEDFAGAVDKVLHDGELRKTLAHNGYELVKSDYSVEAAEREVSNILDSIW